MACREYPSVARLPAAWKSRTGPLHAGLRCSRPVPRRKCRRSRSDRCDHGSAGSSRSSHLPARKQPSASEDRRPDRRTRRAWSACTTAECNSAAAVSLARSRREGAASFRSLAQQILLPELEGRPELIVLVLLLGETVSLILA